MFWALVLDGTLMLMPPWAAAVNMPVGDTD